MSETMLALLLDRPGPPDQLRVGEAPVPEPGPGELRVEVRAVGLNPVDYKVAAAGISGWSYPFILGLDVAGVVDAAGPEVEGWGLGDRVFYHGDLTRPGGYARYTVTTAHTVAAIPDELSYVEAAALPCAGMTAYQALERKLPLQHLYAVLVHGGAGGVGGFAIQLARHAGLEVLTTCSPGNFARVTALGAHHAIDYNREDVVARVRELTGGRGVDAALNTVGPESAARDLEALAHNGHLVCIAGAPEGARVRPFAAARSVHRIYLGRVHQTDDWLGQEDLARMAVELAELVRVGVLDPMVTEVVDLAGIPGALERLAGRHARGKIVAELAT